MTSSRHPEIFIVTSLVSGVAATASGAVVAERGLTLVLPLAFATMNSSPDGKNPGIYVMG